MLVGDVDVSEDKVVDIAILIPLGELNQRVEVA